MWWQRSCFRPTQQTSWGSAARRIARAPRSCSSSRPARRWLLSTAPTGRSSMCIASPCPKAMTRRWAQLTAMVAGAESMKVRPDGVFLVGSGVDIPSIKPTLEAATSLSVTAPEEPEMALARGAALASANAQLGAPSTVAMPYVGPGSLAESGAGGWPTAPLRNTRTASTANPAPIWANGAAASRCWRLSLRWRSSSVRRLPWRLHWHSISGRTWTSRPDISKNVVAPATQAPAKPAVPAPPRSSAVPAPETAAPSQAPAPVSPQQDPSTQPRDHEHDRLHRHIERGILGS
jgi:hypothetical protein